MNTTTFEGGKSISDHPILSREEWVKARKELLEKEKEFTRLRDQLNAESRELPWVRVEKTYVFDGPNGKETLSDLFAGRSQLIVNHFMLGPGWKEGCVGCSFGADHNDGIIVHLEHHDATFVAVSRAPRPEIEAFKKRMGWRFKWVSSFGSDFNYDYHVSFTPEEIRKGKVYYNYDMREFQVEELAGTSMFYKDENGDIFHTYSAFARGSEMLGGVYGYLDHLPKGRNETGPNHDLSDWVRHHDKYGDAGLVETTERYVPVKG
ncbi:MAG TPA: thioredoxin family protein [Chthoniobacterales bacterium]